MTETLEEIMSCDYDSVWLWGQGWQDKRKFKGRALSGMRHMDGDWEKSDIINARVKHGWVISVSGDWDGCGGDYITYFCEEEPHVVDGKWDGGSSASFYDPEGGEDGDGDDVEATVMDGPHKATWLSLR